MPSFRYVILHHSDVDEPHFDLMFETYPGSPLATWRSDQWPIERPLNLTRLRDHRRFYLDYEGPVSDHRGAVQRVTDGQCEVEVGELSVWTIKLLTGTAPTTLVLRPAADQQWRVEPR
jgi:hypothetical protein